MVLDRLAKEFDRLLKTREFRTRQAKRAISIIVRRTKSGLGVNSDKVARPKLVSITSVGPKYALWRQRVLNRGDFFPSGRKSNITLTGQVLEATGYRLTADGYEIFIKNTRRRGIRVAPSRGSRNSKATTYKTRTSNRDVARHVSSNGRAFWALADREQRILGVEMQDNISNKLRLSIK